MPVADEDSQQYIYVVDKDETGNVTKHKQYGVRYVLLTDHPENQ
jgi:protein-L-isoaspartate(D-aspartate) O-methyltransferase